MKLLSYIFVIKLIAQSNIFIIIEDTFRRVAYAWKRYSFKEDMFSPQ